VVEIAANSFSFWARWSVQCPVKDPSQDARTFLIYLLTGVIHLLTGDCVNLIGAHQDGQNGTHLRDILDAARIGCIE
jgi:hypothetical protein